MTARTIPALSVWPWARLADTRGLRPPSVRPNHPAAPWRRRAPWDVPPSWGEGFGIPTRSPDPLYDGRAEIIPFRYLPVLLGGKGTSHVGWDTGGLPSQGKKLRASNPTRPMFPQRWNACGVSVPPHPLGVVRSQSRGLASASSCRSACGDCVMMLFIGT
jgi:hypothetical protein